MITLEELNSVLAKHKKWLKGDRNGRRAILDGYDLRESRLDGCNLRCAYLEGCNLRDSNLAGCDLKGADLRSANLEGCNLTYARLADCDLRGANLGPANFRGANLEDVNFMGARLEGCNLRGASIQRARYLPSDVIIEGGFDFRGYHFWAWLDGDAIRFRAGCRDFETYADAIAHYTTDYESDGSAGECLARIEFLNDEGKRRWGDVT